MGKVNKILFSIVIVFSHVSMCYAVKIKDVSANFPSPPDSIKIACYWYWLNDNLSPEGAVKDLIAMKSAGISRAFIGMIGLDDIPYGSAVFQSKQWWATLRQALKTAGDLDIEIGLFNCPGWSQSGGPWVKPEQSMRHLTSERIIVKGTGRRIIKLPVIEGEYQDVAVIAYPAFKQEAYTQTFHVRKIEGERLEKTVRLERPTTLRSLTIRVDSVINTDVALAASIMGEDKILKTFALDRYNDQNIVGFDSYAPIIISLPEMKYQDLRIEIDNPGAGNISFSFSEQPMIERAPEKQLAKMCQYPLPMWDYYMWDSQPVYSDNPWMISPESVITIKSKISNNTLEWNIPDGEWIVERIYMRPTGVTNSPAHYSATGLEIDKMNHNHLESHFEAYIGEILRRIPVEERRTLRVLVEDSYETGGQNWTDNLADKFIARYGYSPFPFLPVLNGQVVGSTNISDRFLWDLRRLVADLIASEYVGGLKEIANRNGLVTWLENYGHWGFPGEFLLYGSQSDEIAGEFWSEGTLGDIENRAASSCGHIYGKQRIWAESCTAGGNPFGRYPALMKQRVDRFFTEGINATLLHLFIHQSGTAEEPGIAAPFGNEFNRKNVWFEQLDLFTDYLRRCNYMLQQGRYIADVAYFIGEDTPKMTGICNPPLPKGFSFDYINADVLINHSSVKDGRLHLDSGMEYALLVLPEQRTMRPETLDKIKQLVKDGMTVVGPEPECSPSLEGYPDCDRRVREFADTLWSSANVTHKFGKGNIYNYGTTIESIFEDIQLKEDITFSNNEQAPLFIHRKTPDADIYFLSNQYEEKITIYPTFRVESNLIPQIWNPIDGKIMTLSEYTIESGGGISLPISLEPLESAFIVFVENVEPSATTYNSKAKELLKDISKGEWHVKFDSLRGGPEQDIVIDHLFDWSKNQDCNIAHYSGKAIYSTKFNLNSLPDGLVTLDLGNVMVMAKIKVNGQYAGGVWTAPYAVDITPYINKGENQLEIEVVSTWRNRLIGDATLKYKRRITSLNIDCFNGSEQLQPSGLLGPVRILKTS